MSFTLESRKGNLETKVIFLDFIQCFFENLIFSFDLRNEDASFNYTLFSLTFNNKNNPMLVNSRLIFNNVSIYLQFGRGNVQFAGTKLMMLLGSAWSASQIVIADLRSVSSIFNLDNCPIMFGIGNIFNLGDVIYVEICWGFEF